MTPFCAGFTSLQLPLSLLLMPSHREHRTETVR